MSDENGRRVSRRDALKAAGAASAGLTLASGAQAASGPSPVDTGSVAGGKVTFPNWKAETERPSAPPPAPMPPAERVGFAIVGLGRLSLEEILPAFGESRKAKPVALVSGTPDKAKAVAAQYGIDPGSVYDYASFDRIADNPAVRAVYVVLPNALHRDFVVRAAKAGKHVLCEKPMATSTDEARDMIRACSEAGVKLMIAYRCQYEPYNREVIRLSRSGELGALKLIECTNLQNMTDPQQWRLKHALAGGGALPDVGIYCFNAARYVTGEEPVEVQAKLHSTPGDPRFKEVEETVSYLLRFPSGVVATGTTSYGMHSAQTMSVHTERGRIDLENAFSYEGQRLKIGRRDGKAESVAERRMGAKNQFALELDHMAACILDNKRPRTPGEEGLQDHIILAAMYEAARTGGTVKLEPAAGRDTTRGTEPEDAS